MAKKTKSWVIFIVGSGIIAFTSGLVASLGTAYFGASASQGRQTDFGITLSRLASYQLNDRKGYSILALGGIIDASKSPPFDPKTFGMLNSIRPLAETEALIEEGNRNGVWDRVRESLKPYRGHLSVGKDLIALTGEVPPEMEKLILDSISGGLHAESMLLLYPARSKAHGGVVFEAMEDAVRDFRAGKISLAKPYLYDSYSKPIVVFNALRARSRAPASASP